MDLCFLNYWVKPELFSIIRVHPWLYTFSGFSRPTHPLGDLGSLAYFSITLLFPNN